MKIELKNHFNLHQGVREIFNKGIYELHYEQCHKLHIDNYTFVVDMIIEKSQAESMLEKYRDIYRRCVTLYKLIRNKDVIGYYFTPRALLLNWKYL